MNRLAFYLLNEDDPAHQEISAVVDAINQGVALDPGEATRLFLEYWNGAGTFDDIPRHAQLALTKEISKVQLDFQALLRDSLRLDDLGRLDFPVCLMSGKRSPLSVRRIVQLLAQALPTATRHTLDAGHMAPITHADEVNRLLSNFLQSSLPSHGDADTFSLMAFN